jgi:uncharacterized damage-inducible protein DinB
MNGNIGLLADLADAEFGGESFNGPSLMATLDRLSPDQAAYRDTYEGYSAWGVALHCAYFKRFVAASLGAAPEAYPFDYGEDGFGAPAAETAEAWRAVLDYLRSSHRAVWAAARPLSAEALAAVMPEWKTPYARVLSWLATHDTFHVAQLRSMGVPGVKEPR